jgi:hypothetical protein
MQMLSGDPDTRDKPKPRTARLDVGANYLRSQEGRAPIRCRTTSASTRRLEYNGPAYLGDAFRLFGDGRSEPPNFVVPNIGLTDAT